MTVSFKAVGVLSEPSSEPGKFVVVVAFKQVTTEDTGLSEKELSQQKFIVADAADLAAQCRAVLNALKDKHEQAERTLEVVDKVIAEVTVVEVKAAEGGLK